MIGQQIRAQVKLTNTLIFSKYVVPPRRNAGVSFGAEGNCFAAHSINSSSTGELCDIQHIHTSTSGN